MKFTLSWLKQYLDTEASAQEIADKMTAIGIEVEEVIDRAKAFDGFVVGYVKEAEQHPDADRLKVCKVDVGDGTDRNIVCGAPNARAGIKVAFAPVGSYIPGIDVTLKKAEIRGVPSEGMMCSERELELSDEHNGIIELDETAEIGAPLAPVLGLDDPIIDISVTPNRGDTAGVYGIARDLGATEIGTFKPVTAPTIKATFDTPQTITLHDEKACPLFLGRLIKGVKNGPSPKWLQDQLRAIGLRPISALVDITNYFCIGLNRPLHVYDADKLEGNIHVRLSKGGEELSALNDKEYTLKEGMTVICDDKKVLGLGGIVGGTETGSEEDTVNVLLEAAYFDPITTAMSGRALQIDSDARYRFERGIDPSFTYAGMELATQMILDLCGGEAGSVVEAGGVPDIRTTYEFNLEKTAKLGGVIIPEAEQIAILNSLGFETVKKSEGVYDVTSPYWRHDLEGSADFVEEVLRIYGFDKIPTISVKRDTATSQPALTPQQKFVSKAKQMLATRGLNETITWSFLDDKKATLFGEYEQGQKESLTLSEPISQDLSVMRPSVLPNLIEAAKTNKARGFGDVNLFEVGPVFKSVELVKGQNLVIGGIRTGSNSPKHWTNETRKVDIMDVKADILALLPLSGANINPQISRNTPAYYHPGRSGALSLGKNIIAYFGEIHPAVLQSMGVKDTVVAFEIMIETIPYPRTKGTAIKLLESSNLQPLTRDFAFVVANDVRADETIRAIMGVDKKLITAADIFDIYEGVGVEDGHKSLAISVTLQPMDKTMTDEEIEDISSKIIQTAESKLGAKLRQ